MQGIASLPIETPTNALAPMGGLFDVRNAADMLAEFGREGDTYIVHAAEGETVIPVEVLESNPRMKAMIFKQMEEMGLEPERYIVGNELNSINPVTGQPEFFLKNLFKKVKDVVKKAAPIILPIAAPFIFPAMPAFLATGIGSFAGSKISGASTQDALKGAVLSAFLAGGTRALTGGSFTGSVADPQAGIGQITNPASFQPQNPFAATGGQSSAFNRYIYDPAPNQVIPAPAGQGIEGVTTSGESFLESIFSPSRTSIQPSMQFAEKSQAISDLVKNGTLSAEAGKAALDKAAIEFAASKGPGIMSQYGPLAAAGITAAALAQGKEQEEEVEEFETGADLLARDIEQGDYFYGFDPSRFFGDTPYYAADGGEIVGPGTGTSDSIPAMLSDGEFVMTANAVKGAGGGDREKGAKRMYAMMKQYERTA